MLELALAKSYTGNKDYNHMSAAQKRSYTITMTIVMVLWIIFFLWAFKRAKLCSSSSPDSRAIHYLFAVVSPVLYVIFSYSVLGCGK